MPNNIAIDAILSPFEFSTVASIRNERESDTPANHLAASLYSNLGVRHGTSNARAAEHAARLSLIARGVASDASATGLTLGHELQVIKGTLARPDWSATATIDSDGTDVLLFVIFGVSAPEQCCLVVPAPDGTVILRHRKQIQGALKALRALIVPLAAGRPSQSKSVRLWRSDGTLAEISWDVIDSLVTFRSGSHEPANIEAAREAVESDVLSFIASQG